MNEPDSQRDMWNHTHSKVTGEDPEPFHGKFREKFVRTLRRYGSGRRVLELGCGQGKDSIYFATSGCSVEGVDFAANAIDHATATAKDLGIAATFTCLDISDPLPYASEDFDGVFSYLSLHYFGWHETEQILREIQRVLTPGGTLAFCVRSPSDPLYGEGTRLEHNMYCRKGHVRHFFTERDVSTLLSDWVVVELGERKIHYLDERRPPGSIVHAVALKAP